MKLLILLTASLLLMGAAWADDSENSVEKAPPCPGFTKPQHEPPEATPPSNECGENEEPDECPPCDGNCENPFPVCPARPIVCRPPPGKPHHCRCKPFCVRNRRGRCIPIPRCPPRRTTLKPPKGSTIKPQTPAGPPKHSTPKPPPHTMPTRPPPKTEPTRPPLRTPPHPPPRTLPTRPPPKTEPTRPPRHSTPKPPQKPTPHPETPAIPPRHSTPHPPPRTPPHPPPRTMPTRPPRHSTPRPPPRHSTPFHRRTTLTPNECGENEEPFECPPCDGSCQNPHPKCPPRPPVCLPPPGKRHHCGCKPNCVRNPRGKCIPIPQCLRPSTPRPKPTPTPIPRTPAVPPKPTTHGPVCGENEVPNYCPPSFCEPSCQQPYPMPPCPVCDPLPGGPRFCRCKPNFVRVPGDGCVPLQQCPTPAPPTPAPPPPPTPAPPTPASPPPTPAPPTPAPVTPAGPPPKPSTPPSNECDENEEPDDCSSCDGSCDNRKPVCPPRPPVCLPPPGKSHRCRCKPNCVRNSGGKCIPVQQCPPPPTPAPPTPAPPQPTPKPQTPAGPPPKPSTPPAPECDENEEPVDCPPCDGNCDNPNPSCPPKAKVCSPPPGKSHHCKCKQNCFRNPAGKCVPNDKCEPKVCCNGKKCDKCPKGK